MPYVRLDGGSLFYRARGAGRPVVLCVHGFCQSSVYWAPMLERIAETGAAALAPDLPGFGESNGVAGPYTTENHAARLATLLDALRLDHVRLVGGSMGGAVAQHFALRHPSRLQRLVLVATGPIRRIPRPPSRRPICLLRHRGRTISSDRSSPAFSGVSPRRPTSTATHQS